MWKYYALLTDLSPAEIEAERALGRPMDSKLGLAERLAADFHGPEAARAAAVEWRRVHQDRNAPAEMPLVALAAGTHRLRELLAANGLAPSKSEAERLIRQRAVKRDGVAMAPGVDLVAAPGESFVLSVGSSRFVRFNVE